MELSYRLLLSLHSVIAVSVYPSLINSWVKQFAVQTIYLLFEKNLIHDYNRCMHLIRHRCFIFPLPIKRPMIWDIFCSKSQKENVLV